MPSREVIERRRPLTRSGLTADLRALGVREGGVLMVHVRMSALGWVVGGTQSVVEALLEALGPEGTLAAYAGWEDDPYHLEEWPEEWRSAYLAELPPFDPELSAADPDHGRIPERVRTWPGARASAGHVARVVAVGARAGWLTADHPWDDPFGPGSPLARLVDAGGQILLLGAPLDTLTILHHAEALASSSEKRRVTYRIPVRRDANLAWREVRDIDSSQGAFPYERVLSEGEEAFTAIAGLALSMGAGRTGRAGEAPCHLFDAPSLVDFAVAWIEEHFGGPPATPAAANRRGATRP